MILNIFVTVFKGFLCRASKICSKCYVNEEIQFFLLMYSQKMDMKETLEKISKRTTKLTRY